MSCPQPLAAAKPMAIPASKRDVIARLQARLARITGPEKLAAPTPGANWDLGLPEIARHLPAEGLSLQGLHEIAPQAYPDLPASLGFAASLAARRMNLAPTKPVLWLRLAARQSDMGELFAQGLEGLGLPRQNLITARLRKQDHLLWGLEEALKSGLLALVIADLPERAASLTTSRRLHLAASQGTTPALLLAGEPCTSATAAATRWQVQALPSAGDPYDEKAPGPPAWRLALTRCRGGKPGEWQVEWHHAAHRFSLVSGFSDRTLASDLPQTGVGISSPPGPALRTAGKRR
jgi:protein ImuA